VIPASSGCELGGSAIVEHFRDNGGGSYTLRITVRPDAWEQGFRMFIGLRGEELQVSHTTDATFVSIDGNVASFTLLPLTPSVADLQFGFNVDGIEPDLQSMTCRPPEIIESPPPPPPPLELEPFVIAPSADNLEVMDMDVSEIPLLPSPAPISDHSPGRRRKGKGISSRTIFLLAGVVVVALAIGYSMWSQRSETSGPMRMVQMKNGMHGAGDISPPQAADDIELESQVDDGGDDEEAPPRPRLRTSLLKSTTGTKKKWTLTIDFDGAVHKLTLPMSSASTAEGLREAIAQLCTDELGEDAVPAEWLDGDFGLMVVQFLDQEDELVTLQDEEDF